MIRENRVCAVIAFAIAVLIQPLAIGAQEIDEEADTDVETTGVTGEQDGEQEDADRGARIKDIATVQGIRENQLTGIGLVTGLNGKGDSTNSTLMRKAVGNVLGTFGLTIESDEIRSRNSAVVSVTADVPAFAGAGDRLNVHVSSIGDATRLEGGVLLQTNLKAANGNTYAVAQGVVATSRNNGTNKTVATIPGGAIIERSINSAYLDNNRIILVLSQPDFSTASSVAGQLEEAIEDLEVRAVNSALIEVIVPEDSLENPVEFISTVESVRVFPDQPARVVINERSGTIVLGGDVRIGAVGISYTRENNQTGQLVTRYRQSNEKSTVFYVEEPATAADFVAVLKELEIKTDTIIEILKLIDEAGALYGRLIVQ